jgi:MFS family permease
MKRINLVISTLIISDLFLFFGLGLLSPIFGVFVLDHIQGSSLEVVGIATSVYWLARVVSVVPVSWLLDRLKGEKDEYYAVLVGTFTMALLPLLYIWADQPAHIYLIELGKGVANSLAVPAWRILFTKFVDRNLIGFEWSFEDVCVGLATALSAYIGAVIADSFGFKILFVMVSFISILGAFCLTKLYAEKRIRKSEYGLWDLLTRNKSTEMAPLKIDGIK